VLVNNFRHPAAVAKEAATADLMTDGRFELGIGAGSNLRDLRMAGLPVEPPAVRVERVTEAVQILKAFFTEEAVTFKGKHYQIEDLPAYPKPVQKPHLPLMIGANSGRMLRLAAREADIISIITPVSVSGGDRATGNCLTRSLSCARRRGSAMTFASCIRGTRESRWTARPEAVQRPQPLLWAWLAAASR
jgi:alkanesulfonate monooxygenase SsuD/methylene tetrahydromethanopterin reductase-like flavin-dependent oxidoreductase (luciferase family)